MFCIPAVAPIRARIKTPVSGDPVAICEVEFVLSSHVPAAAVTMDIRTFVTFPETGIWIVCDVAAVTLKTIDLFHAIVA